MAGYKSGYPDFRFLVNLQRTLLNLLLRDSEAALVQLISCGCCRMTSQTDVPKRYGKVLAKCHAKGESGTFVARS